MTAFAFLILGMAAYRGARAVAIDSITEPFRYWLDNRFQSRVSNWLSQLVSCGFCTSFWTAGIAYLVYVLVTPPSHTAVMLHLIHWWAVAGLANFLIAVDTFLLREAPPR